MPSSSPLTFYSSLHGWTVTLDGEDPVLHAPDRGDAGSGAAHSDFLDGLGVYDEEDGDGDGAPVPILNPWSRAAFLRGLALYRDAAATEGWAVPSTPQDDAEFLEVVEFLGDTAGEVLPVALDYVRTVRAPRGVDRPYTHTLLVTSGRLGECVAVWEAGGRRPTPAPPLHVLARVLTAQAPGRVRLAHWAVATFGAGTPARGDVEAALDVLVHLPAPPRPRAQQDAWDVARKHRAAWDWLVDHVPCGARAWGAAVGRYLTDLSSSPSYTALNVPLLAHLYTSLVGSLGAEEQDALQSALIQVLGGSLGRVTPWPPRPPRIARVPRTFVEAARRVCLLLGMPPP